MQEIRDLWSCAGVEVESISGSKVRCRMPPYFQGVQEFTQSLEPFGAEIDLETTVNGGAASVVFTVFGDPRTIDTQRQVSEASKPAVGGKDALYVAMFACIVALQLIGMLGGVERIRDFVKVLLGR